VISPALVAANGADATRSSRPVAVDVAGREREPEPVDGRPAGEPGRAGRVQAVQDRDVVLAGRADGEIGVAVVVEEAGGERQAERVVRGRCADEAGRILVEMLGADGVLGAGRRAVDDPDRTGGGDSVALYSDKTVQINQGARQFTRKIRAPSVKLRGQGPATRRLP
jgi:hypothetical protein